MAKGAKVTECYLSESSDDSGINIIKCFIAEPAEENRLI